MFPSLWSDDTDNSGRGGLPRGVSSISQAKANDLIENKKCVLLDVREPDEYAQIRIPGALNLPVGKINAQSAAAAIPSADTAVIVYCKTGRRAQEAALILQSLGYQTVLNMGGISSWPFSTVTGM